MQMILLDPVKAEFAETIAYYNDDKEDEAARFFQKAVELDNHGDSYFYLGVIHANRGEIEKAIEYFRGRIRLRQGPEDFFAEEARKHLIRLIHSEDQF